MNTHLKYKDANENEEYAKVIKPMGDCRLSVQILGAKKGSFFYGKDAPVICKIPGSFRKRIFINKDDYILVSTRDFQKDRVDAMCKYSGSEAKRLMKQGEFPYEEIADDEDGDGGIEWITDEPDGAGAGGAGGAGPSAGPGGATSSTATGNDWREQWYPPSDDEDGPIGQVSLNNRSSNQSDNKPPTKWSKGGKSSVLEQFGKKKDDNSEGEEDEDIAIEDL